MNRSEPMETARDYDEGKEKAFKKMYGKPRKKNTHLTPKKKKRK